MRSSTWFEYIKPELVFFQEYIAVQFSPINVDVCVDDFTAHAPGATPQHCMECSHCTSPREPLVMHYITDYKYDMCTECFEDLIIKEDVETSLWSVHYSLINTGGGISDISAVPSVLGLLSALYRADARTGHLMSPVVRKNFWLLREVLHQKALKVLTAEFGVAEKPALEKYILVQTTTFPGDEGFTQRGGGVRAVHSFVANEVQAELGFSVVRATKDALKLLRSSDIFKQNIMLQEIPTKQLLQNMHVFTRDGMRLSDAYKCAAALVD